MCFDTTATNIGRQSAACDDRKQAWQESVVSGMFTMLWSEKCSNMCYGLSSGSIIGLFSFMTTVWLQNDDSQFHTAYACVEVLMKLAILFQCKFLILVSRLVIITMNCYRTDGTFSV